VEHELIRLPEKRGIQFHYHRSVLLFVGEGVHHMPYAKSHDSNALSLMALERPRCPRCHTRMNLAGIIPGPKGFDLRNFECGKCDHVVTLNIATDPMKSDKIGWLAGHLKPPD
jgi:hypothetical protein